MYKEIKIHKCDRCGETIYDNCGSRLVICESNIDFCDKCYERFKKFWNEFFRPDPFSDVPPFKPNKKMMYNFTGGEILY